MQWISLKIISQPDYNEQKTIISPKYHYAGNCNCCNCYMVDPWGQYDRISYTGGENFSYKRLAGDIFLPFSQKTLDSLTINIPLENFKNGALKKPVSVPGTYKRIDKKKQGLLQVLQAPVKGIYESIDIIFLY